MLFTPVVRERVLGGLVVDEMDMIMSARSAHLNILLDDDLDGNTFDLDDFERWVCGAFGPLNAHNCLGVGG